MAEIVYVLTNEAMDGLVKIGRTSTSVEQRIKELDNTSIPLPFQCFFAGEVQDSAKIESLLHSTFSNNRVRNNREFFRVDANQVRSAILIANPIDVTPKTDVVVDVSDIKAMQKASITSEKRSKLKFSDLGISVGDKLTFVKDEACICTVVKDGEVKFDDQILSTSKAALIALKKRGYEWSTVNGNDYWSFEGETLTARRLRLEDEQ
jgi:T5orf172 domain